MKILSRKESKDFNIYTILSDEGKENISSVESPSYEVVLYSSPVAINIFTTYHSEMHTSVSIRFCLPSVFQKFICKK